MTVYQVESLNIGLPKKERFNGREIMTGICKTPVSGPVRLSKYGFEGDGVADLKHHGGSDKAVCFYSSDHYPYWRDILGIEMPAAAFGENLTVSGLNEGDLCIGDIFQVGTATLQISQPRQPCKTLAARYGRDDMAKLVVGSGYTGLYFRVLEEGIVEKGSAVILVKEDHDGITISFANDIYHHNRGDCEAIERILGVSALSDSWRESFLRLKEKCR